VIHSNMLFQQGMDEAVLKRFQVVMDEHLRLVKTNLLYLGWVALLCVVMGCSYLGRISATNIRTIAKRRNNT